MRFISPKIDFAFKKIFGSNESKDILISFLNALIYEGNSVIKDLEILDPYNPGSVVDLKDTYLDVRAILDDGTTTIIEMQVLNVAAFEKRVIYNLAKTYANQLKAGQGYSKLTPVIALTITDFLMFAETEKIITRFTFRETEELFEYRDREVKIVFVELPKFTKDLQALANLTDKWIYFLKDAPSLDVIPTELRDIQEISKALNIANKANLSVEELEKLDKREVFLEDQRGSIIKARQEAHAAGKAEGKAEGIIEGKAEGIVEGKLEECLALALRLVNRKFTDIPASIIDEINTLSLVRLEELLTVAILDFNSLTDLSDWLQENLGDENS